MIYTARKKAILATVASVAMLCVPMTALAVSIVPPCARSGELVQLSCMLETGGNIAQLILGLTGGLALLMFVYGGFLMLSSGGSEEKVKKGKDAITAAVIGIFIILFAGYLIRYGLARLGVGSEFTTVPTESETSTDTGTRT